MKDEFLNFILHFPLSFFSLMDVATQWGLPEGFQPVRYAISDSVKEILRGLLRPNEPVVISLANEGDTISLVGTPYRLFAVKTNPLMSGAAGNNARDFPWEAITDLKLGQAALNVKFSVHFRSSNGRTPEVGRRAAMGKPVVENYMPFESAAGQEVFAAMTAIIAHKREASQGKN